MSLFSNKKINAFGLDVSDASIKALEFKHEGRKVHLKGFASVPLADKIMNNHMIVNEKKLSENILRAIDSAKNIDSKYVVCSIPEVKSFVRTLRIPKMDESEIGGALPYELEQDIPIPIDQVYMDWQLIQELPDQLEVLVSAAPREYIDSLISSLHMAKLKPVAMELESFATARALISAGNLNKQVLIVDISTTQTGFCVVQKGIIQYTSSVPIAGNAFTESVARNLGITPEEAEKLKRKVGLSAGTEGSNVRQAIFPILDNIVDEIKNVMRFFEEHVSKGNPIDMIFLCGGSSKLLGIADYISGRLNLGTTHPGSNVMLGSPWINLADLQKNPPMSEGDSLEYATAAGLALRGFEYENN